MSAGRRGRRRYEAGQYWERTLAGAYDESGVAYPNLAVSFNRALYAVMRRAVSTALEAAGTPPDPGRVLDVGSGTGVWIEFWKARGATDIVGVELTDAGVTQLAARFPDERFVRGDVADPGVPLPDDRDVVSAMSVLLHIVDDERFERALARLAGALVPGGTLILIEPALVHGWHGAPFGPDANSKARSLEIYRRVLEGEGVDLVHLAPVTILLANPVDTRSAVTHRALQAYWRAVSVAVGRRERAGRLVGRALGVADDVLRRTLPNGPSAKVLVGRKRGDPTAG